MSISVPPSILDTYIIPMEPVVNIIQKNMVVFKNILMVGTRTSPAGLGAPPGIRLSKIRNIYTIIFNFLFFWNFENFEILKNLKNSKIRKFLKFLKFLKWKFWKFWKFGKFGKFRNFQKFRKFPIPKFRNFRSNELMWDFPKSRFSNGKRYVGSSRGSAHPRIKFWSKNSN